MQTLAEAGFHLMTVEQQHQFLKDRERHESRVKAGELIETKTRDQTGREISTFSGPKSAWMNQFKSPAYRMIKIDKHAKGPF
ncbi:hypothetical protein SBC1_31460 [Caballeronia sp. SBC1]|uniref:hypothetical protein n=1 Tax=Caballeronia sp. SBC1 TaxID=2705548 RepID=UPI00140DA534|nr:hypothetical protein [Caballeronia sp. SBC1]QIN63122.1 hypothetical protein SBC1_31460 [Caballeronia sp. SBC1]